MTHIREQAGILVNPINLRAAPGHDDGALVEQDLSNGYWIVLLHSSVCRWWDHARDAALLHCDPATIHCELKEIEAMACSSAPNRSAIGSMNELSMHLEFELERTGAQLAFALYLVHMPMFAVKGSDADTHLFPDIVTRELFGRSGRG